MTNMKHFVIANNDVRKISVADYAGLYLCVASGERKRRV